MHNLPCGMHTGVGAARRMNADSLLTEFLNGGFYFALHRFLGILRLPSAIRAAIIFNR
jgi:hypothetical protein